MEYIIIVLLVLLLVLSAAIIAVLLKIKGRDDSAGMLDEFRKNREELTRGTDGIRTEVGENIKTVSSSLEKMTKENYESRITLSESLNAIRVQNAEHSERQTKALEQAIQRMQEGNEKKLDEMRKTVDEKLTSTLTTRLDSSFKTVSEQLENLYKTIGEMQKLSTGVTDNVTALNRMLTNVKSRGVWAEVQLEGILDQTVPGMFVKEFSPSGSGERVEFALKIPAGDKTNDIMYLPIDSKFPLEDYIRLCDAADAADKTAVEAARKALETRVTNEAKDIKNKYIMPPVTTPFAILYLATEGLYAEIASSKNGIMEKLHNDYKVLVAGPSTVTALLNSLSVGFRTFALSKRADEVMKILGATKSQYDKFGEVLETARTNIERAGKSLGTAQDRNRIIRDSLRKVELIDSGEADSVLGIPESSGAPSEE